MSRPPFKAPSSLWGWILYGFAAAIIMVNAVLWLQSLHDGELSGYDRAVLAVGFSIIMAFIYLLFGYHYLRWAAPRKVELYDIAIQGHYVLFEKYDRIFVNEAECRKCGGDPHRYKRLRQSDLRDIIQKLNFK